MSLLLFLVALQPAPTLHCHAHRELCELLGDQAQPFSQALWRLRTLGLPPIQRRRAMEALRRAHTPAPSAFKTHGPDLELRAYRWRLWGFQETLLIARSWQEEEPELLTPGALAICIQLSTHQSTSSLCANEDYLAQPMPPGTRAQLSREDGAVVSWPAL